MNKATIDQASTIVAAGLVGQAVGDALGVPVEFQPRESLDQDPVTGMRSGGSHNQPAGTWSDDSSLAFCLAESICETGINYEDQTKRFIGWLLRAKWTPHGEVFDVGNATREAIFRLDAGVEPVQAGPTGEFSCGNGSLMRILPIALYLAFADPDERIQCTMNCSCLTHGHERCQLACVMYVEVAAGLVRGMGLEESVWEATRNIRELIGRGYSDERGPFRRLTSIDIASLSRSEVSGSGYVIHCLESSLWCASRADSYRRGVLEAVNLGQDTDTTGAVTGGLLGLLYGIEGIPQRWIEALARRQDVLGLAKRFERVCRIRWELDQ